MKQKRVSGIVLMLLLIGMLALSFSVQQVKAELEITSEIEPFIEFMDFHNGTRQMVIDYNNGTIDYVTETFLKKTAELSVLEIDLSQSVITLPTSLDQSTDYIDMTQTVMMEQEVLMGFTYEIVRERWERVLVEGYFLWIRIWYLKVGYDVDIRLGLRLPVNVTLTYPEQMQIGKNYTFSTTLIPIDKPDFNEFLCVFKANVWVELWVRGVGKWKQTFGPDYDFSKSLVTPLGTGAEVGLFPINVTIWDIGINFWIFNLATFLQVKLSITPAFGSEKITAKSSAFGDGRVVEGANLTWSMPNQRLNFTVEADDYDPITDHVTIMLSDFKYFFTKLMFYFDVVFDFHDFVNQYFGFADPKVHIVTVDVSWLLKGFYLPAHPGYPRSLSVTIRVEGVVPPSMLIIPINIDPNTLNLRGKGMWITSYIELQDSYDVADINVSTIRLNGTIPAELSPTAIGDYDNDTIPDLMVKFNRTMVSELILSKNKYGDVTLTVTGRLYNGTLFQGSDVIRAMVPGDVDGDFDVDIYDLVAIGTAYGSNKGKPRYNANCDINDDKKIDIYDVVIACANYGQKYS